MPVTAAPLALPEAGTCNHAIGVQDLSCLGPNMGSPCHSEKLKNFKKKPSHTFTILLGRSKTEKLRSHFDAARWTFCPLGQKNRQVASSCICWNTDLTPSQIEFGTNKPKLATQLEPRAFKLRQTYEARSRLLTYGCFAT